MPIPLDRLVEGCEPAVTPDGHQLAGQGRVEEYRDRALAPVGVLAGADRHRRSQRHVLQAIQVPVKVEVFLRGELGRAVGTDRIRRVTLAVSGRPYTVPPDEVNTNLRTALARPSPPSAARRNWVKTLAACS